MYRFCADHGRALVGLLLAALYILNPLTAIVEGTRSAILFGRPPDWRLAEVSAAITVGLVVIAFTTFKRMDKHFADVI